ncbi:MAG: hypothetical protein KBF33_05040 [Comamonas sp.]|nr:hypothetical protein [Comamonas sp.]
MNEFLNWMTRWIVRLVMLAIGTVFFLSLLAVACVLAAVWALRMLWAKLTGQPVVPWVMPMRAASSWASMYQRSGGFGGGMASAATAAHTSQDNAAPFTPAAGTKRGGILSTVAAEVSDVQPREVHDR